MIRITRFDSSKADDNLLKIELKKEVKEYLANLVDYAIDYFKNLKKILVKEKSAKLRLRPLKILVLPR